MTTELDSLFEKNIGSLAVSLDQAVRSALVQYERLQQLGQKSELAHIYISFMLSSVLCKLPWLRIDLYDGNDRNDITECFTDWGVPNISDKLYRDLDVLAKRNNRMKDYELEQAWIDSSNDYYKGFEEFMPAIIDQCTIVEKVNCRWHFGQFLGSTVVVRESSKK